MRFAGSRAAQDAFNAISDASVDYNKLGVTGQESQSLQKRTAFDSQAKMKQARDQAEALVASAKAGAAATGAQATAGMFGDIMGGISGIAGAIPMGGGGGFAPSMAFDSSVIPASAYGSQNVYGIGGSFRP